MSFLTVGFARGECVVDLAAHAGADGAVTGVHGDAVAAVRAGPHGVTTFAVAFGEARLLELLDNFPGGCRCNHHYSLARLPVSSQGG